MKRYFTKPRFGTFMFLALVMNLSDVVFINGLNIYFTGLCFLWKYCYIIIILMLILDQFNEMEFSIFYQKTFIFLAKNCLKLNSLLLTVYPFNICK